MADETKYEKLNESNYRDWALITRSALESSDAWEFVAGPKAAELEAKEAKVQGWTTKLSSSSEPTKTSATRSQKRSSPKEPAKDSTRRIPAEAKTRREGKKAALQPPTPEGQAWPRRPSRKKEEDWPRWPAKRKANADVWYVDSGVSRHINERRSLFKEVSPAFDKILTASGQIISATA
ncbi:hypothetical protein MMC30_007335 [Trapelia coarctata]|nr:hypothetical protein [Trapelia coarctata]